MKDRATIVKKIIYRLRTDTPPITTEGPTGWPPEILTEIQRGFIIVNGSPVIRRVFLQQAT